jgi:hypothetical protein
MIEKPTSMSKAKFVYLWYEIGISIDPALPKAVI